MAINRTKSGWQARLTGQPSRHFAASSYGGSRQAHKAAESYIAELRRSRRTAKRRLTPRRLLRKQDLIASAEQVLRQARSLMSARG